MVHVAGRSMRGNRNRRRNPQRVNNRSYIEKTRNFGRFLHKFAIISRYSPTYRNPTGCYIPLIDLEKYRTGPYLWGFLLCSLQILQPLRRSGAYIVNIYPGGGIFSIFGILPIVPIYGTFWHGLNLRRCACSGVYVIRVYLREPPPIPPVVWRCQVLQQVTHKSPRLPLVLSIIVTKRLPLFRETGTPNFSRSGREKKK